MTVLATGDELVERALRAHADGHLTDHELDERLALCFELDHLENPGSKANGTGDGRLVFAAFMLAGDPDALEALAAGLPVERARLRAETLEQLGEAVTGPPLKLDDELELRLRGTLAPDAPSEPGSDPGTRAHTWTPIDLVALQLDPPPPPTTLGLLYPGRRHVLSGEPETLKTWAALAACAEEIRADRNVLYIDLENGAATMLDRLRALGIPDEQIRRRFHYLVPAEPMTEPSILADVEALLADLTPSLVVFDSFTGALALHDLDPNSGVDVERFYRAVVAPIQDSGAAWMGLDHLAKQKEGRGKFSIGSERKIAAADVHLGFEVVRPFGRGKTGLARILTHKDRPGHLARPRAAELELTSHPDTGAVTWTARPAENPDDEHPFRPTRLMEKVSRYVAAHVAEERPSRHAVEEAVTGRREYVRQAIDLLVAEGFLGEEDGPRGARQLRSVKPFTEANDHAS